MLFISSKIPEDYKVVNAPELADRVYPGVEYHVLDENDMIRVYDDTCLCAFGHQP